MVVFAGNRGEAAVEAADPKPQTVSATEDRVALAGQRWQRPTSTRVHKRDRMDGKLPDSLQGDRVRKNVGIQQKLTYAPLLGFVSGKRLFVFLLKRPELYPRSALEKVRAPVPSPPQEPPRRPCDSVAV